MQIEEKRFHVLDLETSFANHLGRTARGKKSNIVVDETFGKVQ